MFARPTLAAAAMIALTILFLALDSASYALDRRGLRLGDKLRWSRGHLPTVAGYGASAFLVCSIPVVNLVALPLLVVSGTLLVVEAERGRSLGCGDRARKGERARMYSISQVLAAASILA